MARYLVLWRLIMRSRGIGRIFSSPGSAVVMSWTCSLSVMSSPVTLVCVTSFSFYSSSSFSLVGAISSSACCA